MLAGVGQLRLSGFQRTLAATQGRLRGVVLTLTGVTLGQQFLLADKSGAGLTDTCLLGRDGCLRRIDIDLQILGIEPCQYLVRLDPVADIHVALNDLAVDPERKLRLHPCLDIAGQRHAGGELGGFHRLHVHAGQFRRCRFFLAAADQHCQGSGKAERKHI